MVRDEQRRRNDAKKLAEMEKFIAQLKQQADA